MDEEGQKSEKTAADATPNYQNNEINVKKKKNSEICIVTKIHD